MVKSNLQVEDQLHTFSQHLSYQILRVVDQFSIKGKILVTGGGAHNSFIIGILNGENKNFIKPSTEIIDFKEALIFAFLGLNRILGVPNTLASVTGASRNSTGGNIFLP